jgi:hypothetical protein
LIASIPSQKMYFSASKCLKMSEECSSNGLKFNVLRVSLNGVFSYLFDYQIINNVQVIYFNLGIIIVVINKPYLVY